MNYEQKYKEARRLLESIYPELSHEKQILTEKFFPELKESEDERIRKELLEHCKNQAKPYIQTGNKCPQIQSWIDWLEKQGEKKPADSYCQENCKGFQETGKCFTDGECKAKKEAEQKSAWSEEDEQYVKDILALIIGHSLSTHNIKQVQGWLKSLKGRVQPQNTWKPSVEQMEALKAMARYCEIATSFDARKQRIVESLYSELKKLKEDKV